MTVITITKKLKSWGSAQRERLTGANFEHLYTRPKVRFDGKVLVKKLNLSMTAVTNCSGELTIKKNITQDKVSQKCKTEL